MERPPQPDQKFAILRSEPERPRKLHQQRAEFSLLHQWLNAIFEVRHFSLLQNPRVGEALVQFGRESKQRIGLHLPDPQLHDFRFKRLIKRTVDLDDIKASREDFERMLPRRMSAWKDKSVPVRISPSGGTDVEGGGHWFRLLFIIRRKGEICQ